MAQNIEATLWKTADKLRSNINDWLSDVRELAHAIRKEVVGNINSGFVPLNWHIGERG